MMPNNDRACDFRVSDAHTAKVEQIRKLLVAELGFHASPVARLTCDCIAGWVGLEPEDPAFLEALIGFVGRMPGRLLEMHFLYNGDPLDDEVVRQAYKNKYLTDPVDGKAIYNFERVLIPYFRFRSQ